MRLHPRGSQRSAASNPTLPKGKQKAEKALQTVQPQTLNPAKMSIAANDA
jgi:hypothetical protein